MTSSSSEDENIFEDCEKTEPGLASTSSSASPNITSAMWRPNTERRPLPMYKDKPEKTTRRESPSVRKIRKTVGFIVFFTGILYLVYNIGKATAPLPGRGRTYKDILSWGSKPKEPETWPEKQQAVKNAFIDSWNGYKKYAWGKDVYRPVSKTGVNMGPKPLGWIIVDSLDTLHIMGLKDQLKEARTWVHKDLDYNMDYEVNTFETTIRMLGGMLSAHYLTKDDMYLDKAADLGNRLLGAFDSISGIPYSSVNLHSSKGKKSHTDLGAASTAEAATLQLEFKYLAKLTGESLYWEKVEKILSIMDANKVRSGLVPIYIQPDTGQFSSRVIRLGSRGDSYYEYLIKQYLQTNEEEPIYKEMYDESVQGIKDHLIKQSTPNKLTFIGELNTGVGGKLSTKMDHLVCFAGGMLAIGATNGLPLDDARRKGFWSTVREADIQLAMELTHTCYEMYSQTQTGLAPEIVYFNTDKDSTSDFTIKRNDGHNLQRPETVESLFILWRLTKNPIYREWGWNIFKSFEHWTKLQGDAGYASINDVRNTPPAFRNNMESFWLSETLKYLYLLFDDSDELLPLTDVVFNTEAHPFPKFSMDPLFKTGWSRSKKATAPTPGNAAADEPLQKPIDQTDKKPKPISKDDRKEASNAEARAEDIPVRQVGAADTAPSISE
ncbi:mannosyl-oligosaccharide 1,2-alpha-mannosidase [Sugiyamaella lignohabitans]|uniref:alpha-1,2-Mannosidase n=1 Tax=Sugiyamaella lignohabitans TaxID=796027 RepID=A0A167E5K1_9ASCO|nr:mannosyl-oligosaccharide 1,2-alpha-mannosidase [Sugiyamaella lignohabitans]ANB13668.1 mannosyl-oligosaccharide 1,2-alpha-mannosidase [Sugiyamaella lignohabitans]